MSYDQATDTLLMGKLMPPHTRAQLVARPHLAARLDRATRGLLTLVVSPAGFGKTTLLAAWARSLAVSDRRLGWLTVDRDDNDPQRFWLGVSCALVPESVQPAKVAASALSTQPNESLLRGLLHELSTSEREHVLVLDDYHSIHTEEIDRQLTWFIERVPGNVHVVIASRVDPDLPLARLRARGQLSELGPSDLRFDHDEAGAFFAAVMGLQIRDDQVARLQSVTEGWPAGLQLAGLAIQSRDDQAAFIESFAGAHRYVVDYLIDEVLNQQTPQVQSFLLQTVILDRLAAPLCDAVTESADSQAMLERIERANLFLVPLDDERRWYRYHQMFAEAVRARAPSLSAVTTRELHRRASAWFASNGFPADAVRHALAAEDLNAAAALIERAAPALLRRAEVATVRGWLESLPSDLVYSRPALALAQAWALVVAGHAEEGATLAHRAEAAAEATELPEPASSSLKGNVAAIRAHAATRTHAWANAIELSQQALAQVPDDNPAVRALAALNLGTALRHVGDQDAALHALRDASALGEQAGDSMLALYSTAERAQVYEARGELRRAARTYERAFELGTDRNRNPLAPAGMAHVGLGKVFREWNRLDEARQHLEAGIALGREGGLEGIVVDGSITLALVERGCARFEAGHELLRAADRIVRSWHDSANTLRISAFDARLHLAEGRLDDAVRWANEIWLPLDADKPDAAIEIEYTTLARVHIAHARVEHGGSGLDAARSLLTVLLSSALAEGRNGAAIEVLSLQALTAEVAGDLGLAHETLLDALRMAESEGYVRTFVDEGAPMAQLLVDVLGARRRGAMRTPHPAPEYIEHVLAAFRTGLPSSGKSPSAVAAPQLAEPLSARELEVLRLLVTGASNREIASSLVVGVSTVKTHVNRILRKLEVPSRSHAIARAHALQLVD